MLPERKSGRQKTKHIIQHGWRLYPVSVIVKHSEYKGERFLALEEFIFSGENRDKKPFFKKSNFYNCNFQKVVSETND